MNRAATFAMHMGLLPWLWAATATASEKIDISLNSRPNDVLQVSIDLEAGGTTIVRPTDSGGEAASLQRLPMSVSGKLRYVERRLPTQPRTTTASVPLAVRYYETAEAVIKVDQSGLSPTLAENRRLIVVEKGADRPTLYSPECLLKREELDLLDAVGSTSTVDELLPEGPVASGESWPADSRVMAALLTLDTVAVCEVQSVLDEFNGSFAKVRLAGVVHGTADGAATEQEVRGVYLVDRQLRQITRLNLAVQEKRSIGGATPGLDAVAKVKINIGRLDEAPKELNDDAIAKVTRSLRSPARDLIYDAPSLGLQLQHDRQWFMTSEQREAIMLRRVDGSDLVAQCTVTLLPEKSAGRLTSLEQFQKDVVYSLGKGFGSLASTRQWQNANGHYCYEVVVHGNVEETPVEWHYYLVSRESGHRVSLAVTIEGPMVKRVGDADRVLVERLSLYPPTPVVQTAMQDVADDAK